MTHPDNGVLSSTVGAMYDRLRMEHVLHIPSSSVTIKYHPVKRSADKGILHSIKDEYLNIDIYATNENEGIKVAAAFFANQRLKVAKHFGARHGSLLYILPIIHLLATLLIVTIGALGIGFLFGIIFGTLSAITVPFLIFWISDSLEKRRTILKENLKATTEFESDQEIDEFVTWLGTKTHTRKFWIKRLVFYEAYYIPIIGLMVFLYFLG
ncbi:MAG: hypothetical protein ACTSRE_00590 [Promethearchaeota archaeon]